MWIKVDDIVEGGTFENSISLGLPYWEMSQGGNLESELSVDLS